MRRLKLKGAALAAGLLLAGTAVAQPAPVVTRQQISLGGRTLAYTAEVGRTPIADVETGEAIGHVFYVAYRATPVAGKVRPITFIWNGGPSLPAASLHFEGAGPRRIQDGRLVDNADTWLTDSDLVFMDPVGTGFSRATAPETQKAFTSIIGDVAASAEFVRAWVLMHGAEDAPLVIAGQSYGSRRAGAVGYRLVKSGFKVKAIALISNTSGLPTYPDQELISSAIHVADYAVTALHFRKLPAEYGTTPDAARAAAERWTNETYLPALRRRDSLTEAERTALAAELARRTGLAPADIDRKTLIVGQGFFLGRIMPGQRLYYSDYREREPYKAPPLNLGVRYLRHDLGYASPLPYLGVEPIEDGFAPSGAYPKPVGTNWVHSTVYGATIEQIEQAKADFARRGVIGQGSFGPPMPGAADAVSLKPSLKVFVAHGAYDPLGGCSMDAELGRRLTSPHKEAISFRCYPAAHAIYRDAPARAMFAEDMRALARQAAAAN